MIKNNLISIWRNFFRNKWLTLINITGFSLGIASCLMIGLYVVHEKSYDTYNQNFDNIYRVNLNRVYPTTVVQWAPVAPGIRDGLLTEFPEIKDATRISSSTINVKKQDGERMDVRGILADTSFLNIFTVKLVEGNPKAALSNNNGIIITRSLQQKLFNDFSPLGKTLEIKSLNSLFTIEAVIEDPPENSHFHYDMILPVTTLSRFMDLSVWGNNFGYYTYILLDDKTSPLELEKKFPAITEKYLRMSDQEGYSKWREAGNNYQFVLQPLSRIHLYSNLKWEIEPNGNWVYVYLFSGIGILVLLIAIINFMNLSTARYSTRLKEIGIRKILGSSRSALIVQFLLESICLSFISLFIAMIAISLTLPLVNQLTDNILNIDFMQPQTISILIGFAFFTGIIAGIYPSLFLSAFNPTHRVGSGLNSGKRKVGFRNSLILVQFIISFFLLIATFIVFRQMNYMINKDLGYKKENVLVIDKISNLSDRQAFIHQLKTNPHVLNVAVSSEVPGKMTGAATYSSQDSPDQNVNMTYLNGDENLLDTWGVQLIKGRNFRPEDAKDTTRYIILNETAVKELGLGDDPIGKVVLTDSHRPLSVLGVVKDFNIESLQKEIRPLLFAYAGNWVNKISVRIAGTDVSKTVSFVEDQWEKFVPGFEFQYFFLDDYYNSLYHSEQITSTLLILFAVISILISVLGLYGLTSFLAEQKTKEIGIRKALGSTIPAIIWLFLKGNYKLIMIASLIAAPVSWYSATQWLQNFAFRINVGLLPFIISFAVILLIASATIIIKSYSAARINPVNALRDL